MIARLFLLMAIFVPAAVPARAVDCNSVAQAVAAQYGGDAIWASPVQQGNTTVCEVKVKIPGKQGQPPRIRTVRVPG